jgi:protocatechuate 3,4-dioxygenase beta subunit
MLDSVSLEARTRTGHAVADPAHASANMEVRRVERDRQRIERGQQAPGARGNGSRHRTHVRLRRFAHKSNEYGNVQYYRRRHVLHLCRHCVGDGRTVPVQLDILRQDITEGRSGLPLRLELTVVNVNNSCGAVANAVVEIWQCDAAGNYSEYAQPGYDGRGQTFLRGAQTTDGNGRVTFTTIYPGWYAGRATHVHVEVRVNGNSVKTTQIAFPEDVTAAVYVTGTYAAKGQNSITNASDNVFADGTLTEMATLTGNPTTGYTGTLTIGIAV